MTLTENKFLENLRKYGNTQNRKIFNDYSNYNLARLIEGFKGDRGKAYIINGKLINSQRRAHIHSRGALQSNFLNWAENRNRNNAKEAFKTTIPMMTKAQWNRNYGTNYSNYNNLNVPSQLKFPPLPNLSKNPRKETVTLMPGALVRTYIEGPNWVEYNGKRYPYLTTNNRRAFNTLLRKPNANPTTASIGVRNILGRLRHFGPYLPAVNYRGRRIHGHGTKRHVLSTKGRKIYKFHYTKPVRTRKVKPFNVVLVRDKLGRARHFGPYVPAVNYRGRRIHGHGNKRHVLSAKGRKIYKFHYVKV